MCQEIHMRYVYVTCLFNTKCIHILMLILTCLIFSQAHAALQLAKNGINMIKKGMKKAGKKIIKGIIACVKDNGMEPRLQTMLVEANLPTNYEDITSNESEDHLADQQAVVSPQFMYHDYVSQVYLK